MIIPRRHPELANRDCGHCLGYLYYETGPQKGKPAIRADGSFSPRPRGTAAPCFHKRPGGRTMCPKGRPFQADHYTCNAQAYHHNRECRAVGSFPDDPTVRYHATILASLDGVE